MKSAILPLIAILAIVAGCVTPAPAPTFPLVTYTTADEHEAAAEIRANKSPVLSGMATDYFKLRCAIRWTDACANLIPTRR